MPSVDRSIPLFLDCDPGIDDAVALGYLLCQDDVDIVGIAASGGNVPTAQVVRNTLGWLELAGRTDIPVHPGAPLPLAWRSDQAGAEVTDDSESDAASQPEYADLTHGPTGTGYAVLPAAVAPVSRVDAARAWAEAARAHPGELIGVVLGPATNLALALDVEPELPCLLKRIFIMGGAFNHCGNTHPTTEWNVTFDPESTARVLAEFGRAFAAGHAQHVPVIAPIEATEAIEMTPARFARIVGRGGQMWSGWLAQLGEALRFYFEFHEWDGLGTVAHLHDPFVLACALAWARDHLGGSGSTPVPAPTAPAASASARGIANGTAGALPWARTIHAPVDVELTGALTRGETVADWRGRWGRETNAEIIRTIDAQSFLDHLGETLRSGPAAAAGVS